MADDDEEEHRQTCWEKYAPGVLRDKLCAGRRPPPNRKVYVDNKLLPDEDTMEIYKYPDNRVMSSKYTFLTFLPKNLFEQFRRVANFYFLCVALTQFMIDTPVTPITSVLPLLFVISITAVKQGYEDFLRHKADSEVNHRPTVIIRNGQVQRGCRAMDIRVGDIVKTYMNEEFPCDMVLLSSEDSKGHCFITTANLDGETNLKTHYSQLETRTLRSPQALGTLRASITCKPQTADLYSFQGVMHFGDADPQPLGPEHVLLRGARLKNTPWVYGCAIYTGKETKMALNSNFKKAKFSRVERKLNTFLILFLLVLVLYCVIPTAFKYWWEDKEGDDPWYFWEDDDDDDEATDVLETALAFMVLINYIIPISLYVTIEMQKFFGSMFFNYDVEMYDADLNEPAVANTSDLNEELGQVEYLFTDKTGTLTENTMSFRKCIIGKRHFEEVDGMLCEKVGAMYIPVTDPSFSGAYKFRLQKRYSEFHLGTTSVQHPPAEMTDFLRVLVLCHTVRVDRSYNPRSSTDFSDFDFTNSNNSRGQEQKKKKKRYSSRDSLDSYYDHQEEVASNWSNNAKSLSGASEYSETGQEYEYQASSPDEKAFVEACCKYGTIYHGLVDDIHEVSYQQEMHRFKLLETLPFDALRKRMSVIIRDSEGKIFLLCKGAEIAIFDRVVEGDIEATQKCIDDYAMCGYRTLCLARRKLTEEQYSELSDKLAEARLSLVDRSTKVAEVYNECERDLTLLGATAVEDKLQEEVPETISALREAGIKVWVLTGDKEETAVNISHSAGHFNSSMSELRLTQVTSAEQCREQLAHLLKEAKEKPPGVQYSLVVDGKSLAYALRRHPKKLRALCSYCVAVLCCRMSPIQKAEVVNLIRTSPSQPVTAAIGDGANDVSMIQEADVGFGIMGKEGRQAVCNSDFAFGKFRYLRRALLLHGHYYYHRLAVLVKYFFYKNVAWVTCQIYFAIFSYWSQQTLYDPFYLTFYNMTSTSLPILIYGIFEQCKPSHRLVQEPKLYRSITRNKLLSWRVFIQWMALAVWHSLVFFFSMYFMEDDKTSLFKSGYSIGLYDFGTVIAYGGIISVNIKLMIETYYWCWPMIFSYVFALVGSIIMAVLYTCIFWPSWVSTTRDLYGVPAKMYSSLSVWLCLVITIIAALLPDVCFRVLYDQAEAMDWSGSDKGQSTPPSEDETTSPGWAFSSRSDLPDSVSPSARTQHILEGRATLEDREAEMTSRSSRRREVSFAVETAIELENVRRSFNYGTADGTRASYDNPALSVSDLCEELAKVPAVVTIKPGQEPQRIQQHQRAPNGSGGELVSLFTPSPGSAETNGLPRHDQSRDSLPPEQTHLSDTSWPGTQSDHSRLQTRSDPYSSCPPVIQPSNLRPIPPVTHLSNRTMTSPGSQPPAQAAPVKERVDAAADCVANGDLSSQPPVPPQRPSSASALSHYSTLLLPLSPSQSPLQSSSPSSSSLLIATQQLHPSSTTPAVTPDLTSPRGQDNLGFSPASEGDQTVPAEQMREKHVSFVDVVVRL